MKVSKEDKKLIREYVRLRGNGLPQYDFKSFVHIFSMASDREREMFREEMKQYKEAIKSGAIKKGQEFKTARVPGLPSGNDGVRLE